MPEMSLSEAASWAGKRRSTTFKGIKAGRLSARKDDQGQFRIDPAELARVFQPAGAGTVSGNGAGEQPDTGRELQALQRENALLREWLTDARTERHRLAGILETQTRLLTDQRLEKHPSPPLWWRKLREKAGF
jgi:hypothetical protein